jgi:polyhydroxyalkanoate synthesis regulator phasin
MFSTIKTLAYAGLGVQDKIHEALEELARRGQSSRVGMAQSVGKMINQLEKRGKELQVEEHELLNRLAERLGLPSKRDIERLEKRIQELSQGKS